MVTFASAFPATNNLFKPRTRLARDQSRSDSRPFPSVAAPSQLLIAFQGYFNRKQQFQLLDHCLMGAVAPDRNYPTFSCSIEASVCFFFKASHFQFGESFPLFSLPWPHTRARVTPRKFHRSSSGSYTPSTLSNAVLQQFGVFSKWKRTLNFFGQRRGNNDSYNDPSFALDFDEEKRSLHFYEILHPLLPLSVSLPPCFILACTSQVTLAPCFLRARSVAAFCSAHRRGIPARQFIRKVFFAFSGALAADYTSPRSRAHGLPSVAVVWREGTHLHTRETSPRCAKKTGSRVVAAHFRRGRWKYRTRIPVS